MSETDDPRSYFCKKCGKYHFKENLIITETIDRSVDIIFHLIEFFSTNTLNMIMDGSNTLDIIIDNLMEYFINHLIIYGSRQSEMELIEKWDIKIGNTVEEKVLKIRNAFKIFHGITIDQSEMFSLIRSQLFDSVPTFFVGDGIASIEDFDQIFEKSSTADLQTLFLELKYCNLPDRDKLHCRLKLSAKLSGLPLGKVFGGGPPQPSSDFGEGSSSQKSYSSPISQKDPTRFEVDVSRALPVIGENGEESDAEEEEEEEDAQEIEQRRVCDFTTDTDDSTASYPRERIKRPRTSEQHGQSSSKPPERGSIEQYRQFLQPYFKAFSINEEQEEFLVSTLKKKKCSPRLKLFMEEFVKNRESNGCIYFDKSCNKFITILILATMPGADLTRHPKQFVVEKTCGDEKCCQPLHVTVSNVVPSKKTLRKHRLAALKNAGSTVTDENVAVMVNVLTETFTAPLKAEMYPKLSTYIKAIICASNCAVNHIQDALFSVENHHYFYDSPSGDIKEIWRKFIFYLKTKGNDRISENAVRLCLGDESDQICLSVNHSTLVDYLNPFHLVQTLPPEPHETEDPTIGADSIQRLNDVFAEQRKARNTFLGKRKFDEEGSVVIEENEERERGLDDDFNDDENGEGENFEECIVDNEKNKDKKVEELNDDNDMDDVDDIIHEGEVDNENENDSNLICSSDEEDGEQTEDDIADDMALVSAGAPDECLHNFFQKLDELPHDEVPFPIIQHRESFKCYAADLSLSAIPVEQKKSKLSVIGERVREKLTARLPSPSPQQQQRLNVSFQRAALFLTHIYSAVGKGENVNDIQDEIGLKKIINQRQK